MQGLDWTSYQNYPAPPTLLCQFRRWDSNDRVEGIGTFYAKDFSHSFNVHDLEWRLTGIAKEQLDRMPEEARLQVMPQSLQSIYARELLGLGAGAGLGASSVAAIGPLHSQLCSFLD